MTNVERIRREIEHLIEIAKAERTLHPKTVLSAKNYLLLQDYAKLLSFIDSLEQESLTEDVDEAAKAWYDGVKYKSDLSGTPIMAFKGGVKYERDRVGRLATDMRDKGLRNQLDAYKSGEDVIAGYWDGFADCAKAVLRELDKKDE